MASGKSQNGFVDLHRGKKKYCHILLRVSQKSKEYGDSPRVSQLVKSAVYYLKPGNVGAVPIFLKIEYLL
jgi:hypothetical protein